MATISPIPQPPTLPIVGNAHLVDKDLPINTFVNLAKQYGPIYQLTFPGPRTSIFASSLELVDQLCDQKRFRKNPKGVLKEVRHLVGDGLFTAFHGEAAWDIAHRVLVPAFGPAKIRGMFGSMADITSQLVGKWERFGPDYVIDANEDFTRLTFDVITLCAMSYRLNSFYSLEMSPFIKAMSSYLVECGNRARRPGFMQTYFSRTANVQFEADKKIMLDLTHEIIEKRKANIKAGPNDLLQLMLTSRDPVTGLGMSDENIASNLVTFLIAGHETTSGLLSFAVCHLLDNPSAYAKVRTEVDTVLRGEPIRPEHLGKLTYITAVLRETLRLRPPLPIFTVESVAEEEIVTCEGKQYIIPRDASTNVFVTQLHKDTSVWGEDAEVFRPERMLNGGFERAPVNAWKPWGNGSRACIGRPLAWQEALITLACVFQKFDLVHNDPAYQLSYKYTLTVKPRDFFIRAIPRPGAPPVFSFNTSIGSVAQSPASSFYTTPSRRGTMASLNLNDGDGVDLYLAYGSNSGTCRDFAQRVGNEAPIKGFIPHIITLDSIEPAIPTNGPLIIFTASYEGEAADNARRFVETLQTAHHGKYAGVKYAMFGCGHHDWKQTYQRIPMLVDRILAESGAERIMERAEADSGADEFFDTFDAWVPGLWEALGEAYGDRVRADADGEAREQLTITMTGDSRPAVLKREEATKIGKIVCNRLLTEPGVPAKHHIEIELPEDMHYEAGDYLSILPRNPEENISRVLSRFSLLPDQNIMIKSKASTTLPTNKPVSVWEVLAGYVEIGQTATRKNIQNLIRYAPEDIKPKLAALLDNFKDTVIEKHLSVLDVLELYPEIDIPLASFLSLLPAMRIRQYSISSSPLWNLSRVSITLSVVELPNEAGLPNKFLGVASNYLAKVRPGDPVHVGIRSSAATFRLPEDPSTSVVMFAAGSGIAPMRGFIQQRAHQVMSGRKVGKMVLFYGCRSPDQDFLYAEDNLKEWQELGFLDIKPAFSRKAEASFGCKYVQDRVWHERDLITEYFEAGAKFYTCGSPPVANGLKETLLRLIKLRQPDWDDERLARAWEIVQKDRLATDVFA
ncbi:hypothetical protein M422DRAFT_32485 [Sphaerobolus stellatus SS14]|uniref:Cytochrome P450 n=1 Tax=Sphaerobolus stellatus (strain SS14) TaxID=990650 RepID=A0A0C9UYD0_SPHS4|nr:hypothetical protein M422DRAFT_32485 [Sphaerobolus stellatus SS14]